MTSISLLAKDLVTLLSAVLPLASKDKSLPALCAVHLQARDGYLIATATDRYVAGSGRVFLGPDSDPEQWSCLIDTADVKAFITEAKRMRAQAELTIDDTTITIGQFGDKIRTARLVDAEFSKMGKLILAGLETDMQRTVPFGIDPAKFGQFAAATKLGDGMVAECWMGPKKTGAPIMITCGTDFVGLIMTCALHHLPPDARRGQVGDGWAELLTGQPLPSKTPARPVETVELPAAGQ